MNAGQIADDLKNWIPYTSYEENENLFFRWLYLGDKKFDEPFFDETISRCKEFPENSSRYKTVSSGAIIPGWADKLNALEPTAIIFHVSRCGSTLLTQLLSLDPANTCLSEVPVFDQVLRYGFNHPGIGQLTTLLKSVCRFYGVKRSPGSTQLFIKTDSWHIHFYKEFRQLFPDTPFIFLYRKPDEVLRSQQKQRGMQSIPGLLEPGIFNFKKEEISGLTLDEYMCKVLESYFSSFINLVKTDKNIFLLNYADGGMNMITSLSGILGKTFSSSYLEKIKERLRYHAKYPDKIFEEADTEVKFPDLMQRLFEQYKELEKLRDQTSAHILNRFA